MIYIATFSGGVNASNCPKQCVRNQSILVWKLFKSRNFKNDQKFFKSDRNPFILKFILGYVEMV